MSASVTLLFQFKNRHLDNLVPRAPTTNCKPSANNGNLSPRCRPTTTNLILPDNAFVDKKTGAQLCHHQVTGDLLLLRRGACATLQVFHMLSTLGSREKLPGQKLKKMLVVTCRALT